MEGRRGVGGRDQKVVVVTGNAAQNKLETAIIIVNRSKAQTLRHADVPIQGYGSLLNVLAELPYR